MKSLHWKSVGNRERYLLYIIPKKFWAVAFWIDDTNITERHDYRNEATKRMDTSSLSLNLIIWELANKTTGNNKK